MALQNKFCRNFFGSGQQSKMKRKKEKEDTREKSTEFYLGTLGLTNVLLLSEVQSHGTDWNCTEPLWIGMVVECFESISYHSLIVSLFTILLISYKSFNGGTVRLHIPTILTSLGLLAFCLELSFWIVQFSFSLELSEEGEGGCRQGHIPERFQLPLFLVYGMPQYIAFFIVFPAIIYVEFAEDIQRWAR